ncbi:uncharacterized protein N7483_012030 [Penicillium malachiteum]|uniref:uncharacterized protein n=1 Tax=Penicillium malachiteum TaxID=1324776 RepID=UPI00254739B0|nr:uncharacterized protein N7483_012030 [Penicillium malachiteum]KAJ5714849.1 hypothetical protein N7483_012030 [Penicillium malachiteum]
MNRKIHQQAEQLETKLPYLQTVLSRMLQDHRFDPLREARQSQSTASKIPLVSPCFMSRNYFLL